ncbi:unnamed protein product [Rotaria sordida]|uniref:Uncharacterized protein n=1 Tax=Rotaria sordida TaxID=392033 RepID=A0A816GEZ6_9BILA|nr:unnamed protein product [Rotaria sordida]CAF1673412.1 unnamed protein product [Rotaria sordida]
MMLDRFLQILPEIHNEIKWLDLHSSSMKDILCAADYPNLYDLGLYNIDAKSIQYLLTVFYESSYQNRFSLKFIHSPPPSTFRS